MTVISSKIDLRNFSKEILDQGREGSCVANAVVEAIRIQSREYHQDVGLLARDQIYYDARPNKLADTGTSAGALLTAAMNHGIAHQSVVLPYTGDPSPGANMYQQPSAAVYADAATQKVLGYTDLTGYLIYKDGIASHGSETNYALLQNQVRDVIGTQLMHGKAVVLGVDLPRWFDNLSGPLSTQTDHTDTSTRGGHELVIIGKDDNLNGGSYIVQNSWGDNWGDHGYGSVPYKYIGYDSYSFGKPYVMAFTDIKVIDGFKGVDVGWTSERGQVAMAYAAILDRAVEHNGLDFWANALKGGMTLQQLCNSLVTSAEGSQLYGSMSNSQFINTLYQDTLGRNADAPGLQFWSDKISSGTMSRGDLAYALMTLTANTTATGSAPTMAEHDFLMNRTTLSETFGLTYQITDHLDAARHAVDYATSNADSVQVGLVGIQHEMGWA